MRRVGQPVLPFLPAEARSVGPSAGLLEGVDGGVVFVFGLATYTWPVDDDAGRRLAAVQLVETRVAAVAEVASAFGVDPGTVWRWRTAFTGEGVLGLVGARPGPKGPSKLTEEVRARIVELRTEGLSLAKIAERTGVSTATVRVALGTTTPKASGAQPDQPDTTGTDDSADGTEENADATGRSDGDGEEVSSDEALFDVEDEPAEEPVGLPVLARPVPRTGERTAARFGLISEASVVITQGSHLPLVGLLLALPALEATGLLQVAEQTYGRMRHGFYGLRVTLLTGVFLALLREPRAEGATRVPPADLGRLLGLDRAPEVKTLRRKLAELAAQQKGAALQAALGAHHLATRPDALGFLYVDGHVRVYSGTRPLPKTHIARMRIAGPATEETWVTDADGDPVLVLVAPPSQSLAAELNRILPDLRALVGPDRRCTVVFDRGGYSPKVFAAILTAGFDILTYYKGTWTRSAPSEFTTTEFVAPDGVRHVYELAERTITLDASGRPAPTDQDTTGNDMTSSNDADEPMLTLRLVVRRSPDGHQTPILTSRTDLMRAEVAYRMGNRWRQENYFKYGRQHFALDALDSYADTPDDPTRLVPNPAKAKARNQVTAARAGLVEASGALADALDAAAAVAGRRRNHGKATVDPTATGAVAAAQARLDEARRASRETPTHVPLGQVRPDARLLETETKLLTHAIRMSAYNTESTLARLLRPHYRRGDDEARALLREAFTLSGDLEIIGNTLHVRLDPATAPRRSKALAALCAELTDTQTRYPGTDLVLAYSVKGHRISHR